MHIKYSSERSNIFEKVTRKMATVNDTENDNSNTQKNNNNCNNNNSLIVNNNNQHTNNNEETASTKSLPSEDANELKVKKQTLEQRKVELEKLLSEKSWLLQQIQKTEMQIQNGNYEYLNLNEIFSALAHKYQQEQSLLNGCDFVSGSDSAILRRRNVAFSKQNSCSSNINNNSLTTNSKNKLCEDSNRSSDYDNYPQLSTDKIFEDGNVTSVENNVQLQMRNKSAILNRSTPTPTPGNLNFLQLHRQQHLKQQQKVSPQQQRLTVQPNNHQQRQYQSQQFDAISLYSINSANVATLRQQHIVQQQPIIVQCDKYYLSPTHQNYNDSSFIRSSQNIKQYISPLGSPSHYAVQYELTPQKYHSSHQMLTHQHYHQEHQQQQLRQFDAISLAPSYVSMESTDNCQQSPRWRSHTHLSSSYQPSRQQQQYNIQNQTYANHQQQFEKSTLNGIEHETNLKSTDILPKNSYFLNPSQPPPIPHSTTKPKPFDEISLSSINSDTQKKSKPKQWLESSLDGPIIRTIADTYISTGSAIYQSQNPQINQKSNSRDRTKLSSQSMSAAARHYSVSNNNGRDNKGKHVTSTTTGNITTGTSKFFQNDDGRYAKLSQSTSFLNTMETGSISAPYPLETTVDLPNYKYLGSKMEDIPISSMTQLNVEKIALSPNQPPPRPPPLNEKSPSLIMNMKVDTSTVASIQSQTPIPTLFSSSSTTLSMVAAPTASNLSPDIRIESPKNMTVVQQATFQPYKEITKPFEMSDFYKYSTKFRQKESNATSSGGSGLDGLLKNEGAEQ